MVRKHDFSVELINAETIEGETIIDDEMMDGETRLVPFKEHETPSSCYVEVEPEAEYWIRVTSHLPKGQSCMCTIKVDRKPLDPCFFLPGGESRDNGVWSRKDKVDTEKALRVKALDGKTKVEDEYDNMSFWIGEVEVSFFEAVRKGTHRSNCNDSASSWEGGKAPKRCVGGEKSLASTVGTKTITSPASPPGAVYTHYECGAPLETIILKYCTARGLIYEGILAKPADWDDHRKRFPIKEVDPILASIKPELGTSLNLRGEDGEIVAILYGDLYDLLHLEDDVDGINKTQATTDQSEAATAVTDESSAGSPPTSPEKHAVRCDDTDKKLPAAMSKKCNKDALYGQYGCEGSCKKRKVQSHYYESDSDDAEDENSDWNVPIKTAKKRPASEQQNAAHQANA